jgi:hypothetical protein
MALWILGYAALQTAMTPDQTARRGMIDYYPDTAHTCGQTVARLKPFETFPFGLNRNGALGLLFDAFS